MKKIIFVILTFVIFLSFNVYALNTTLLGMRNKIFEESKQIKLLLATSQDAVLIISMWDTCIITMTQLDAYFSMLGIFNTIKKEDLNEESIGYLIIWLSDIKDKNQLNIKNLNLATEAVGPATKDHIEKLRSYYGDLSDQINTELDKISLLKKSLKKPSR